MFHDGQFKPHCRLCKVLDHETGDIKCPMGNNGEDLMFFRSHTIVFSNLFPCEIKVFNNTFNSAEHAYKWSEAKQAGYDDLAEIIKNAPHAGKAK